MKARDVTIKMLDVEVAPGASTELKDCKPLDLRKATWAAIKVKVVYPLEADRETIVHFRTCFKETWDDQDFAVMALWCPEEPDPPKRPLDPEPKIKTVDKVMGWERVAWEAFKVIVENTNKHVPIKVEVMGTYQELVDEG